MLLTRLQTQLEALDRLLSGISDEALTQRPIPGKWSALEHIAHVGRYHEVFLERFERILCEDQPTFTRYRSEDDPGLGAWFALPVSEVFSRLRELRSQLVQRANELEPDNWKRIGIHPAFGPMTLEQWLEFFLVHEAHHVYAVLQRSRGV